MFSLQPSIVALLATALMVSPLWSQSDDRVPVLEKRNVHVLEVDFLGESAIFIKNFDLGKVRNGEVQQVELAIRNLSMQPFTMESVSLSCSCTDAKVPNVKLEVGQVELATFTFPIENVRGSLTQSITATIACSGSVNRMEFTFKTQVSDVARFAATSASFKISDEAGLVAGTKSGAMKAAKFEVPLLVDDVQVLGKLKLEPEGDLPIKQSQFIMRDRQALAIVEIETDMVSPDGSHGALALVSPYGRDVITVAVVRESIVSVHPKSIVFVREGGDDRKYIASAMAKIKFAGVKSQPSDAKSSEIGFRINSEKLSESESPKLSLEGQRVGNGIYRLKFHSENEPGRSYDLPKTLEVHVEVEQVVYPIVLELLWSN